MQNIRCLLICSQRPEESDMSSTDTPYEGTTPEIDWKDVNDAMGEFAKGLAYMKSDARPRKKISAILDRLSARLTRLAAHGELHLIQIRVFDANDYRWQGTFSVEDGIVHGLTSSKIPTMVPLESLAHGTLRPLDVPAPFLNYFTAVHFIMLYSPQLQDLILPTLNNTTLAHISFVCRSCCHTVPDGLIVTLRQQVHARRRGIAIVRIYRCTSAVSFTSPGVFIASATDHFVVLVEIKYWKEDHISEPMTDGTAVLLKAVSRTLPFALKSFDLGITAFTTEQSLIRIKNVLRRSALEQLHIRCVTLEPSLDRRIVRLLRAVPWSTLMSLVLSGDQIDRWVRLWTNDSNLHLDSTEPDGPYCGPQLMRLVDQRRRIGKTATLACQRIGHPSADIRFLPFGRTVTGEYRTGERARVGSDCWRGGFGRFEGDAV